MKTKILLVGFLVFALSTSVMAAENLKEMFAQGSIKGSIKLLDFTRDFDSAADDNHNTAVGGSLYYKTDSFKGISLGAAFGTTNVVGDDSEGFYYGLSAPVHEDVTRLQEYYVQGEWFDTKVKVGAHELNTPFMNIHPIRTINRSYRGLSLSNKSIENLTLSGFYLTDYMGWVDEEFVSFPDDVLIAGAIYKVPVNAVNTKLQAWYFTMPDGLDQTYTKVNISKKFDNFTFHAAPTLITQRSKGDEHYGEIDTYQYGLSAGVGVLGFDLTGFYAKTGDDSLLDRWGYGKIIIQQVRNSGDELAGDRGGEKAYAARLSYDFGRVGVKGLSAYAFYADYDAPEDNINETDFSVQYNFSGAFEGLGLRARHAIVDADSGTDLTDTRFYVTYRF